MFVNIKYEARVNIDKYNIRLGRKFDNPFLILPQVIRKKVVIEVLCILFCYLISLRLRLILLSTIYIKYLIMYY